MAFVNFYSSVSVYVSHHHLLQFCNNVRYHPRKLHLAMYCIARNFKGQM